MSLEMLLTAFSLTLCSGHVLKRPELSARHQNPDSKARPAYGSQLPDYSYYGYDNFYAYPDGMQDASWLDPERAYLSLYGSKGKKMEYFGTGSNAIPNEDDDDDDGDGDDVDDDDRNADDGTEVDKTSYVDTGEYGKGSLYMEEITTEKPGKKGHRRTNNDDRRQHGITVGDQRNSYEDNIYGTEQFMEEESYTKQYGMDKGDRRQYEIDKDDTEQYGIDNGDTGQYGIDKGDTGQHGIDKGDTGQYGIDDYDLGQQKSNTVEVRHYGTDFNRSEQHPVSTGDSGQYRISIAKPRHGQGQEDDILKEMDIKKLIRLIKILIKQREVTKH